MDTSSQPHVSGRKEGPYKIKDPHAQQLPSKTFPRPAQVTQKEESATCSFQDGMQPLHPGLSFHLLSHCEATREVFSPKCSQDVTGSPFFTRKQSKT